MKFILLRYYKFPFNVSQKILFNNGGNSAADKIDLSCIAPIRAAVNEGK